MVVLVSYEKCVQVLDESESLGIVLDSDECSCRRRGRPPRGNKQVVAQISMQDEEKEFFSEMASVAGMSLSAFAREAMNEYIVRHRLYVCGESKI